MYVKYRKARKFTPIQINKNTIILTTESHTTCKLRLLEIDDCALRFASTQSIN